MRQFPNEWEIIACYTTIMIKTCRFICFWLHANKTNESKIPKCKVKMEYHSTQKRAMIHIYSHMYSPAFFWISFYYFFCYWNWSANYYSLNVFPFVHRKYYLFACHRYLIIPFVYFRSGVSKHFVAIFKSVYSGKVMNKFMNNLEKLTSLLHQKSVFISQENKFILWCEERCNPKHICADNFVFKLFISHKYSPKMSNWYLVETKLSFKNRTHVWQLLWPKSTTIFCRSAFTFRQ